VTPSIFISYSSVDEDIAKNLYNYLKSSEIMAWIACEDIPSGASFDDEIQRALISSTHVVLIVSKASIASRYVKDEIEYALTASKVVIPVIIETVEEMPLRWNTLNHINLLNGLDDSESLKKLVRALPTSGLNKLKSYLEDNQKFAQIQRLLWENPNWIAEGAFARSHLMNDNSLAIGIQPIADFFCSSALGSVGTSELPSYFAVYLCSPYISPILKKNETTEEITKILDTFLEQVDNVLEKLSTMSELNIIILAGQRFHYEENEKVNHARLGIQVAWPRKIKKKLSKGSDVKINLKIASYTRLIELISRGVGLL